MPSNSLQIDFVDPSCGCDLPGTPLQQSGIYASVLREFGCASMLAQMRGDGTLLGRARIYLRRAGPLRLAWLPRGPVWDPAASRDQRAELVTALPRAAPWRALWASSADTSGPRLGVPVSKGVQMAQLDLRPDEASRRAALDGKWRNRLKRAEAAGLRVIARPLDMACDAPFLQNEEAQRRARRYAALPPDFTSKWATLAPRDSLMLIAEDAGAPIAFMLMLLHSDMATYHIGWTGACGRALNAHTLLLWRASCLLAQSGYSALDLGRTDAAQTPGIARFKLGTGAAGRELGPTRLRL
ncbi:GNAT family N-acetyltransferase [Roseovarius sp. S4756]|uniref:GNAT family N-acetyltransferase n=1 Tax=Roseovarius maritimus TaxID=3342637 RepID=UPI00372C008D